MRTDAKIGFAIGAVLLAVLTVYAIVVPKHKKSNTTVSLVTPVPVQPTASSDAVSPTPPPIAAADSPASKETVAPTPVLPTPATGTPLADNSIGGTAPGGFHPVAPPQVAPPQDLPKTDDSKPGTLVDGVYTPANITPTHRVKPGKIARTISPLPDDTTPDIASAGDRLYVIKPGQTLSKIAYEVYGNSRFWVAIQRENKGLDSNHLKVGSKINLPDITPLQPGPVTVADEEAAPPAKSIHTAPATTDAHSYIVKTGDSLYGIAKRLLGSGRQAEALYALNRDLIGPDKSKLKLGMVLKLPDAAPAPLADRHSVR